jgi:polysaccharide biosynthesis/export protein
MRWYLIFGALGLAACSSNPQLINTGQVAITTPSDLPAPTIEDLASGQRVHLVGPFDKIAVDVHGLPDLSREVRVDAGGSIALPLAGQIDVNGRTPQQIEAMVTERLRGNYVREPRVTVSIVETVSQVVTVDGEVRQPGLYPVQAGMTLMRAIARAQGTTEFAAGNHVVLFRTVNGQQMAALYDLRAIRLGAYQDPAIAPNDVIYVGESRARRIFPQIVQGLGILLSPLITVLGSPN